MTSSTRRRKLAADFNGVPMGSFSCPHFDVAVDYCLLLKTDCISGRPGCVLAGKSKFAVRVEERIRARAAEKKAQRHIHERK